MRAPTTQTAAPSAITSARAPSPQQRPRNITVRNMANALAHMHVNLRSPACAHGRVCVRRCGHGAPAVLTARRAIRLSGVVATTAADGGLGHHDEDQREQVRGG
eukprot:6189282-Pleurochrysis_carterae.AAC.2